MWFMNRVTNQDHCGGKQGLQKYATELISLPSRYEKSINLHLQKFIGKSQKLLLNQNNISHCLAFSPPLQPRHIPNASGCCLPIQLVGISTPLFVMLAIFLSTFTCIYFVSTFHSRGTCLVATESHALQRTWNGLITNHSVDLQG